MTTTVEITIPSHELPDWMRQARRGIDWGVLLVFAFSLTIALPFITQDTLPHTNASENYVYRTEDYALALREGRFYPRWSPNALTGYGSPIPNYYAPGAAYVPAIIQLLFTDDAILAVRIMYIAVLSLAGTMTYLFVTRRAGSRAGVLAALLYLYSPYVGLTAPYILGDLPGVIILALMPTLLWSIDRLISRRFPLGILLVTLTTTGLYLTNVSGACISTLLAFGLVIWQRHEIGRVHWLSITGGYLLGLGAAGFYWIPALLERDAVIWRTPVIPSPHTLTLAHLISFVQPTDVGAMLPAPQLSLGIAIIVFSVAGIITTLYFRRNTGFQALFFGIGITLVIIAISFFPSEIRLLGAITLCFAIGSTAVLSWRARLPRRWRRIFLPVLLIFIWISAIPVWLPPVPRDPFGSTDGLAQVQHELQGYGVAVLPPDQPIPSTLAEDLPPDRNLLEGYLSNNLNKIPPMQLNTRIQVGVLNHDSHSDLFQIRADAPGTLNVLTAFFPGWRASVSGHPIPLRPDPTTGQIQIDIPLARTSELYLSLGTTGIRLGAWIITWVCLFMILVINWRRWRNRIRVYEEIEQFNSQEARLVTILVISFTIVIILFNSPTFPLSLHPSAGYKLQDSTFIQTRTDTGLNLLAFRLETNQYRSGDRVPLTLYWQTQRFLTSNYKVQLYLTHSQSGNIWGETGLRHPGHYPTRRWKTGLYVTDDYELMLPRDIEPGNYQINVVLYTCDLNCESGERVTFFNANGQALDTTLRLPTLIAVAG